MNLIKKFLPLMLIASLIWSLSCETIYNYDLSLSGLDSLPATESCILKYLPHSVDSRVGQQQEQIQLIVNDLNNYENEIIDSLRMDSIYIDSAYTLHFKIIALDPYDEITEVEVEKIYFTN